MRQHFPFTVIGGGIAGLTFALEVAEKDQVAVFVKKGLTDTATAWAQGGIAAVSAVGDTFEQHIQDTLQAGCGLSNPEIVELVVKEGPQRLQELIERGAQFDQDSTGYHLHQEGGHSQRRIFHRSDFTGLEIQRVLLECAQSHPRIQIFSDHTVIDLVTERRQHPDSTYDRIKGLYVLDDLGEVQAISTNSLMIATGGAGKVYLYTSNPDVSTGDGIAMCYRAGAAIANMEFFQFHPTCMYDLRAKTFLLTEALRGEGAVLFRKNGERFMEQFDQRAELAPRDIVARGIDYVMKAYGEDHVLLDISHRDPEFVTQHFPTVYKKCLELGFDLSKQPIPVVPAAHYCCGGVVCDRDGATSIEGLYVAGECAHTGLHGANRLASNSLLEGLVFSHRAAVHAVSRSESSESYQIAPWDAGHATDPDELVVISQTWDEIRRLMWNYVGIVRSNKRLQRALERIKLIRNEIDTYYWDFIMTRDLIELRNLAVVAELIIRSALQRKESRGLHYTLDYPQTNPDSQEDTVLQLNNK